MDFPWYFPPHNSGEGGIAMKTKRIEITEDILTVSADIENIEADTFAYFIESFKVVENTEYPTRVTPECNINNNVASFAFAWETAFNGYIDINYWKKTE
jgi:GTP:adenosylcobinamide-phosphate guanylyltransferase